VEAATLAGRKTIFGFSLGMLVRPWEVYRRNAKKTSETRLPDGSRRARKRGRIR
jgi:hypothetical protein